MREDVADVDDLPSILDHRDKPALVSAGIEHRENVHGAGVRKIGADIDQAPPGGSRGYTVPVQQRLQRVLVRLAEFGDCRLTNDPHPLKVTKTVTARAREHPLDDGPLAPFCARHFAR